MPDAHTYSQRRSAEVLESLRFLKTYPVILLPWVRTDERSERPQYFAHCPPVGGVYLSGGIWNALIDDTVTIAQFADRAAAEAWADARYRDMHAVLLEEIP